MENMTYVSNQEEIGMWSRANRKVRTNKYAQLREISTFLGKKSEISELLDSVNDGSQPERREMNVVHVFASSKTE